MATLALAAAGASIGGAVLPSIPILGTTISGAALGQAVGALAGSLIDEALFDSSGQSKPVEGPRLTDLQVTASSEGAPIPRVYGRARLAGQIIWATPIEEEVIQTSGESSSGGGKGVFRNPPRPGRAIRSNTAIMPTSPLAFAKEK